MNILSLDRLMEEVNLAESIAKDFVDVTEYNVVTKKANSPLLMETVDEKTILKNGRNLMGLIEADETDGNPIEQPAETTTEQPAETPVEKSPTTPLTLKVTFDNGNSLTTGFNGTQEQATAYYVGKPFNLGSGGRDVITKGKTVEIITESVSGQKIDTIEKFLNAKPVSQADYVEIKTEVNKDAPLDEVKTDTKVEKNAEKAVKDVEKKTDGNKEWAESSKGKNELKTKLDKFEKFVTSLETEETKIVIKKITDKIKSL